MNKAAMNHYDISNYNLPAPSYFSASNYASNNQQYMSSGQLKNVNNSYFKDQVYFRRGEDIHEAMADLFLEPNRPVTPLVSEFGAVKDVTEETYKLLTGQDFPHDSVKVFVLTDTAFKSVFTASGNYWSEGIQGFSLNRFGRGISEVYVRENHLDNVLLTLGHEIGHILSKPLQNSKDEEAKAHAFSIAWMNTIRDNNIAGLKPNIFLNPAKNGVHDAGLDIVNHLMSSAEITALDAFQTLAYGLASKL